MNNILCLAESWFASQIIGVKKNNKDINRPIKLDRSLYLTHINAIIVETFKILKNRHIKKINNSKKLIFNSKNKFKNKIKIKIWPKKIRFLKHNDRVQIKGFILIFLIKGPYPVIKF